MSWSTILDVLVALLGVGSLGFVAYGGWLCVRHAFGRGDQRRPEAHAVPRAAFGGGRVRHPRVLLD